MLVMCGKRNGKSGGKCFLQTIQRFQLLYCEKSKVISFFETHCYFENYRRKIKTTKKNSLQLIKILFRKFS